MCNALPRKQEMRARGSCLSGICDTWNSSSAWMANHRKVWEQMRNPVSSRWFSFCHSHLIGKTPQDWSPQKHTFSPEGQSLEHIVASSDPTIKVHFHFPFHSSHHFCQGINLRKRHAGFRDFHFHSQGSWGRGAPSMWVRNRKSKCG